jgi:hypothetical protein
MAPGTGFPAEAHGPGGKAVREFKTVRDGNEGEQIAKKTLRIPHYFSPPNLILSSYS